jgi:uncharacterized protein
VQAFPVSILLLVLSNVFMTFAWYAHLKNLSGSPWYVAALVSWGITLTVFVPFLLFYMRQPLKLDYLGAALCMLGAVYFIFRDGTGAA